jgi:hypothetical protein
MDPKRINVKTDHFESEKQMNPLLRRRLKKRWIKPEG